MVRRTWSTIAARPHTLTFCKPPSYCTLPACGKLTYKAFPISPEGPLRSFPAGLADRKLAKPQNCSERTVREWFAAKPAELLSKSPGAVRPGERSENQGNHRTLCIRHGSPDGSRVKTHIFPDAAEICSDGSSDGSPLAPLGSRGNIS